MNSVRVETDPDQILLTTLTSLPQTLPMDSGDDEPTTIWVGERAYLCRGVRLQQARLFMFVPASVLDDAVARAVRPALVIGGVGGVLSLLLALWVTQRLTRRIQHVQRRTQLIAAGDFAPMPLSPRRVIFPTPLIFLRFFSFLYDSFALRSAFVCVASNRDRLSVRDVDARKGIGGA